MLDNQNFNEEKLNEYRKLSQPFIREFYEEFPLLKINNPTPLERSRINILEKYFVKNMQIAKDTSGISCTVENIRRDIEDAIDNDYKVSMIFHGGCLQCVAPKIYGIEYCEDCTYFSFKSSKDKSINN